MTPKQLKRERTSLAMSQAELAAALGVDTITVSRWERGVQPIPAMVRLALRALTDETKKEK